MTIALDTLVQNRTDLAEYTSNASAEEATMLIKLFLLTDDWVRDIKLEELQSSYAKILRSQLNQLVTYYLNNGQRNKAKLAVTLCDVTFYAEEVTLSQSQIDLLQSLFIYFQRANLTTEDLDECDEQLYDHGIYTLPEMPNWQDVVLD